MPCPTCDHTMQVFVEPLRENPPKVYHCSRCGTQKIEMPGGSEIVTVPKLVERCREFEAQFEDVPTPGPGRETWHRLGIAESIHRPADRPQGGR